MKIHSHHQPIFHLFVLGMLGFGLLQSAPAADTAKIPSPESFDYATPRLITGTLYQIGSDRKDILFTFRRTATRSGRTVHVDRQFLRPDGSVAAEETVDYNSGQLVSLQMKEFQADVSGDLEITADSNKPAQRELVIGFGHGLTPPKGDIQKLPADIVIDDNLYPFMLAHWDDLMHDKAVKFRFVSLEWKRTFMFHFVKTGETAQNGRTVEQIKMEPTNLIVRHFVKPLDFTVEKDAPHRILSYIGRTTPRVKNGKSWKYLDAETVFDWK